MDIQNRKALRSAAASLAGHPGGKRAVLIYIAISCGLSLAMTLLNLLLNHQISSTGGLGSIGLRSILTTIQTILPVAQIMITLCLGLGYQVAMLDLYRHRSTDPRTLKEGFRRFGPLIRLNVLLGLVYTGLGIAAFYISSYVFALLPFSNSFMELAMPLMSSMTVMDGTVTMDEATAMALGEAMIPMLWIFGILFALLFIPMYYRYRMSSFCLCEDPAPGALAAIRSSQSMMRHNRFALFKLDLGFWWYYLLEFLATSVSMTGEILMLFGLEVHWTMTSILFPILSLGAQFAVYYFFMNRVTLTYAAAYEALRPQPKPASGGVALGNIFDLYRESNEYKESLEN